MVYILHEGMIEYWFFQLQRVLVLTLTNVSFSVSFNVILVFFTLKLLYIKFMILDEPLL